MPGPVERVQTTRTRVDPAAPLRLLLLALGPTDHEPESLYRDLVVFILRLTFMQLAGEPAPTSWPTLRATCERYHRSLGAPLFDPRRHASLQTLDLEARALTAVVAATSTFPSLGHAHQALMALQLGRRADGVLHVHRSDRRRHAGAHYTPSTLTGPLVAATLRPVLAALDTPGEPTPAQLLELRICDPAMGCGAFLDAASEHLTPMLLRAWARHGAPNVPDLATHARRLLATTCLYGVDRDPLAVELAQLSTWLRIGDPALPLAALSPMLRHGDSLVGLDPTQLQTHDITTITDADARITAAFAGKTHHARARALHGAPHSPPPRTPPLHPLHWPLAFPEVFTRARPGFDVMIGNPPFFWGNRIGRNFGDDYRDWLRFIHPDAHGNSDLAAHFLRRAFDLLRPHGGLGFITTNSISEAETRRAGLDHALAHGGVIHEAHRDLPWPGDASVRVALVCVHRGPVATPHHLDGLPLTAIGSDLRPHRSERTPTRLPARAGQSFKGVDFGGAGFLLSASAHDELTRRAPDERTYLWPVLNASGLTRDPALTPTAHIINLGGLSLAEATTRAPHCLAHLRAHVLPHRAVDRRTSRRERWWLYNESCPGLYRAIADLPRVLVGPVVATHLVFAFMPPRIIFTNALNIFAFATAEMLAALQSRTHGLWAAHHGSSLRTDLRYNPSTCFETFPFPPAHPALTHAGEAYDNHRNTLMRRRHEGLTTLYNHFHNPDETDPDIAHLRALHQTLDAAMFTAYGWHDLRPTCEYQRDPNRPRWHLRWPQPLADEVLARLLTAHHNAA